jgi:hypothetical protein
LGLSEYAALQRLALITHDVRSKWTPSDTRAAVMLCLCYIGRQYEPHFLDSVRLIQNNDQEVRETAFQPMVGLELSNCLTPEGKFHGTERLIQDATSSARNGSSLRRRLQFGPVIKLDAAIRPPCGIHDLVCNCMRLKPRVKDDIQSLWSVNT